MYHKGVAHKGANDLCSILLKYIDTGHFEQTFHYFLVHSYLPNNRDFGTMRRMIHKHDRIYTPDEYEELSAQPSNNFHHQATHH